MYHELLNPMVQKFMVEKSGIEKFMVEKSGVEEPGLKLGVEMSFNWVEVRNNDCFNTFLSHD